MLEVNVLGRKISVRYVSGEELESLSEDGDCVGLFDGETIYLKSSLSHERAQRVFLHELGHAVLHVSGLHNLLVDGREEAICDAFESLTEVFRNQEVLEFLSDKAVEE